MYTVPNGTVDGVVEAPPSKSYSQRALILASLADGRSRLEKISPCQDTELLSRALEKFGINIDRKGEDMAVSPGRLRTAGEKIYVGNAGTAMRFLTAFSLLAEGSAALEGSERMHSRPIGPLVTCLNRLGGEISYLEEEEGYPPLKLGGRLKGGRSLLDAGESSQFLSSVLMASPRAEKKVKLNVDSLTSRPYVDLTLQMMEEFGIEVENRDYEYFQINRGSYTSGSYRIEGDYSGASHFFGASAITGGSIRVENLERKSRQGDKRFLDILKRMGCEVERSEKYMEVKGPERLKSVEVDMNDIPDVAQTLALVSAFAEGTTRINNVANLRLKETDRINATVKELKRMGIDARELDDGMVVRGSRPQPAEIETYDDHRMAMGFALAGLEVPGLKIKNEGCVDKSFPNFFESLESLVK